MRAGARAAVVGWALWAMGCHAGAVEPFYTAKDVVPAPAEVVGSWVEAEDKDTPARLEITAGAEPGVLQVVATTEDGPQPFRAVVFALGPGATLVDLQLDGDAPSVKGVKPYVVRPHFLARATVSATELRVLLPGKDETAPLLKGKKPALRATAIPARSSDDEFMLITSPTRDLQTVVKSHLKTETGWHPLVFRRATK